MKRAEYLLSEEGFPIGEQRSKDVPPELLEEVFELNMVLEELRAGDESQKPQLEQAGENFKRMRGDIDRQLEILFREIRRRGAGERDRPSRFCRRSASVLNRRRYIENLIDGMSDSMSTFKLILASRKKELSASISARPTAWSPIWT